MYQVITLYTLNIYNFVYQLHLNKVGRQKGIKNTEWYWHKDTHLGNGIELRLEKHTLTSTVKWFSKRLPSHSMGKD